MSDRVLICVGLLFAAIFSQSVRADEQNIWYYDSSAKVISNEVWCLPVYSLSGGALTISRDTPVGSGDIDLSNLYLQRADGSLLEITKLSLADGKNGSLFSNKAITSFKADDVSYVPTGCFKSNTSITNLMLSYHSSFNKSFPGDAFRSCTKLVSRAEQFIPPYITSIGSYCFADSPITGSLVLTNLASFGLASNGASSAFSGTHLEEIVLKGSFTTLPNYLFYNCTKLKSVSIDANITSIGYKTFQACSALQSLEFFGYKKFSLSTSSTAYNFNNSSKLSSVTFAGLPLATSDLDKILTAVSAVASTATKGKACTIYASKRLDNHGWRGLANGLADSESNYAPDKTFGVYRSGSRKAWLVHRRSEYDALPTIIKTH